MRKRLMLGDKVEALINAVIPKKIVDAVKEKEGGCGCQKRKDALNKLF